MPRNTPLAKMLFNLFQFQIRFTLGFGNEAKMILDSKVIFFNLIVLVVRSLNYYRKCIFHKLIQVTRTAQLIEPLTLGIG